MPRFSFLSYFHSENHDKKPDKFLTPRIITFMEPCIYSKGYFKLNFNTDNKKKYYSIVLSL